MKRILFFSLKDTVLFTNGYCSFHQHRWEALYIKAFSGV